MGNINYLSPYRKVIDSGKGIPNNLRAKVMNPFFTTKEVGRGTGLGLSISASIMEAHRGKLYIDFDSPDTCFVLSLPKAETQSVRASSSEETVEKS